MHHQREYKGYEIHIDGHWDNTCQTNAYYVTVKKPGHIAELNDYKSFTTFEAAYEHATTFIDHRLKPQ